MKTTLIIVILLVLGVGGYALTKKDARVPVASTNETSTTTMDVPIIRGTEDVTLSVGETKTISSFTLTLNKVSDSRCPTGVQCVWAGTVIASVTVVPNDGYSLNEAEISTVDMTIDADPVKFGNYLISLTAASPYPKQGTPIDQKDYVLTFHVAPK